MSKQTESKKEQGFLKDSPKCSNCVNYKSDMLEKESRWVVGGIQIYETNLRCSIGNFKINRTNWCSIHKFV